MWNLAHFPINGDGVFDEFWEPYDASRILTPRNTLDATAYDEYSPLYLPIWFMLNGAFLKVGFRPGTSCSRGSPTLVFPTNPSGSCAQSPRSFLRLPSFGPTRQFGSGTPYHPALYATILGALVPVPFWLWVRRWAWSPASKVYTPAWFTNTFNLPPATGINASSSFVVDLDF